MEERKGRENRGEVSAGIQWKTLAWVRAWRGKGEVDKFGIRLGGRSEGTGGKVNGREEKEENLS